MAQAVIAYDETNDNVVITNHDQISFSLDLETLSNVAENFDNFARTLAFTARSYSNQDSVKADIASAICQKIDNDAEYRLVARKLNKIVYCSVVLYERSRNTNSFRWCPDRCFRLDFWSDDITAIMERIEDRRQYLGRIPIVSSTERGEMASPVQSPIVTASALAAAAAAGTVAP